MQNNILKRTFKTLVIMDLLILILILIVLTLALIVCNKYGGEIALFQLKKVIIVFICMTGIVNFLFFRFLIKVYTEDNQMKESVLLVNNKLTLKVKVQPINAAKSLAKFMKLGGQFYAIKKSSKVVILFDVNNKEIEVERIEPRFFTHYYKIEKE